MGGEGCSLLTIGFSFPLTQIPLLGGNMVQWAGDWGCYKDVCCSLSEVNMKLRRRGGNELMNSSDWVEREVGSLTPPLDLIGGEVRSLTPLFPPIG